MLDKVLKNSLSGLTLIEEDLASVSKILARQLGTYAKNAGKRVVVLSLAVQERKNLSAESDRMQSDASTREIGGRGIGPGAQVFGGGLMTVLLGGTSYDLMVVEGLASYLFDKTDREIVETIRLMTGLTEQGKSFIVTFESGLVSERTASYIRSAADTVIVVRSEQVGSRIDRMLEVRKMKDSTPLDHLVRVTVDQGGIQVDTREFVG